MAEGAGAVVVNSLGMNQTADEEAEDDDALEDERLRVCWTQGLGM